MSAYRSAPTARAPSLEVACARCGAFAELRKGDDVFRCAACGHEQPALRDDAGYVPASLQATSWTHGAYDELVPFASALGVRERCAAVQIKCDGLSGEVSLDIDSGSVSGVALSFTSPGFPAIVLRRETTEETEGRERGITHEVQTGDPSFDPFVFISSDHEDDDVLPVVSAPAVRAAIVALLADAGSVRLIGVSVLVRIPTSAGAFDPARIRARLAALRVIAGAPRSLAPRPVSADVWGVGAALALCAGFFVAPFLLMGAWSLWHPTSNRPVAVGVAAGLVLALLSQPLLARKIRGRSDSHQMLPVGRVASFLLAPMITMCLLLAVNALFDRSKQEVLELVVQSVSFNDEEKTTTAVARGKSGPAEAIGDQELDFEDAARAVVPGQRLTVGVKRGALGWPWRSSAGQVHVGKGVLVEK